MIRKLILGFALLAPVAAVVLWLHSIPLAIGLLFLSHMLILYPTLSPRSRWLGPVVNEFRTDAREVWMTIDDGPDPADTGAILDLLDDYDAKATFFVKGRNAETHPDLIRSIVGRGHSLGNHSYSHPSGSFWCLSPNRIAKEIDLANEVLEKTSGMPTSLFRAPVGHKNPFVHPLLDDRNMVLVGWSARGWDTLSTPEAAARRIMRRVRPGSIILVHQGAGVTHDSAGLACIRLVLDRLSEGGYRCVIPRMALPNARRGDRETRDTVEA